MERVDRDVCCFSMLDGDIVVGAFLLTVALLVIALSA